MNNTITRLVKEAKDIAQQVSSSSALLLILKIKLAIEYTMGNIYDYAIVKRNNANLEMAISMGDSGGFYYAPIWFHKKKVITNTTPKNKAYERAMKGV